MIMIHLDCYKIKTLSPSTVHTHISVHALLPLFLLSAYRNRGVFQVESPHFSFFSLRLQSGTRLKQVSLMLSILTSALKLQYIS